MRNLWKKFALLTIVGSLLCTALVAGCGGGEEEDTGNNSAPAADAGGGDD